MSSNNWWSDCNVFLVRGLEAVYVPDAAPTFVSQEAGKRVVIILHGYAPRSLALWGLRDGDDLWFQYLNCGPRGDYDTGAKGIYLSNCEFISREVPNPCAMRPAH